MKKLINNKFYNITKLILAMLLIIGCFISVGTSTLVLVNAQSDNDKTLSNVSIDEDFDESCVNVVLKPEFSKYNSILNFISSKIHNINNVLSIENMSEFSESIVTNNGALNMDNNSELVNHLSKIDYKQVIKVILKEKSKENVIKLIKEIEIFDEVLCAEPNYYFSPLSIPNDTNISEQWNLIGDSGINMPDSWNFTIGSSEIRVGVIDTGIAFHNDLSDNLTSGYDFYNDNSITTDDTYGHGTSVAGIIGAIGDNNRGVSGINQNITIVPMQIFDYIGGKIYVDTEKIKKSIDYAIALWDSEERISVLNYSVSGFGKSVALLSKIEMYPGLFVWSAGNDGLNVDVNSYISSFNIDNLISVGAHDKNNQRSIWDDTQSSCYGEAVNIYAPGGKGLVQNNENCYTLSSSDVNSYRYFSGTSCAAPHVTGVAALLLSLEPDLTAGDLKNIILNSAENINITIPDGTMQSVKKLNAYNAVKYVLSNYSETMTLNYDTKSLSQSIDSTNTFFKEKNYFLKLDVNNSFEYDFTISSSNPMEITLYDSSFNEIDISITQTNGGLTNQFMYYLSYGLYYLKVNFSNENISGTITSAIVGEHSHNPSKWFYYSRISHRGRCPCGEFVEKPHVVNISEVVDYQAPCLECHTMLDLRYDVATGGLSNRKESINGSYILPSGIIVLVEEDIEPYLNGTLIFHDEDETLVTQ